MTLPSLFPAKLFYMSVLFLRRMFLDPVLDLFGARRSSHFNLGGFSGAVHKSGRHHCLENLSVVSRYCYFWFVSHVELVVLQGSIVNRQAQLRPVTLSSILSVVLVLGRIAFHSRFAH